MKKLLFTAFALTACLAALHAAAPPSPQPIYADAEADEIDDTQDVLYVGQPHPVMLRLHLRVDRKAALANWDGCMAKYFAFLDRNDNKYLDKNEAGRAPNAQMMLQFFSGNLYQVAQRGRGAAVVPFTDLDEDRDGKVTIEEFKAYYTKNGCGPVVLGAAQAAYAYNPYGQQQQDADTDAVFSLLDADKDGKISKKEMEAAESALLKFDSNDDEMVSQAEVGIASQNRGARRIVEQQGRQRQPAQQPQTNLMLIPREDGKRAAGRLAIARDLITRYDKDKDGSLEAGELGFSKKMFETLDRNKDGKLTALELTRWLTSKPAGEFTVRLGSDSGAMMARGGGAMPAKQDGKSDEMGVSLDGVRIKVVQQSGSVRIGIEERLVQLFQSVDGEKKGFVTRKQVEGNTGQEAYINGLFDFADRDGDGKLTEKEFKAALGTMGAMRGSQVTLSLQATGNGLFQMLDTNGDGRLSLRELRSATKRLTALDKDEDGCVSRTEFPQLFQLSVGQASVYGGFVVEQPFRQPDRTVRAANRGPAWFAKMDRNGDGDLSPAEWLGEKEDFDAMDADGDGLISAEEAETYDAKARK